MPGSLRELVKSLMGSRDGVLPSVQAFPPLDVDQIARELKLDTRAEEAGRLNRPSAESSAEDLAEQDILAEIEQRARRGLEDYRSQLNLYEGRIRRVLISTDHRAEIEAAGENALTDFKVQAGDDRDHLFTASLEVKGREQELQAFRAAHRLVRLPVIITPREKVVRWLVLGILILLESILNGLFFAEGSEIGLIGGVTQAFVLSLLNVGAAILYAQYGLPLLVHGHPGIKAVGIGATLIYATWAVSLNLVIGHFRDLFITHTGEVKMADITARLAGQPFVLEDAKSWLLTALGVGISLISVIDASGMNDLYPGYGAAGRRRADAISVYVDGKARCLAGLTQRRDAAIKEMSQVINLMRSAEYELRLAVEGRSRLHGSYRAYLGHLAKAYERLLQRYREENIRTRAMPPPDRFQNPPTSTGFLTEPELADLPDVGKDARTHVIERMEYFIKAINQQFETEVNRFPPVSG